MTRDIELLEFLDSPIQFVNAAVDLFDRAELAWLKRWWLGRASRYVFDAP